MARLEISVPFFALRANIVSAIREGVDADFSHQGSQPDGFFDNKRAYSSLFCLMQLIEYYVKEKYTLRYTGGMVPDVNQVTSFDLITAMRINPVSLPPKLGNLKDLIFCPFHFLRLL